MVRREFRVRMRHAVGIRHRPKSKRQKYADVALACIDRFIALGYVRFNAALG
jgi:hypothetical protein